MSDPITLWRRFLARPNDDSVKLFGVAILVALISAALVSITSVTLKPLQDAHLAAERAARMERMLDTLPGLRDVMEELGVDTLETRLVDLESGRFVGAADPAAFDLKAAETD
ncbi:MAG: NADH:ubiquinone reductase (Na(+)-transporting) subunit C, partial [Alphaproteobacteria bacterium]|nr:NADH:ubiquinone reductase (Na(+)-transporting) subunit C [Alphaproteobacteria bacterium]